MKNKSNKIVYLPRTILKIITIIFLYFSLVSCKAIKESNRIVVASAGKIESLDPAQANTLRSLQLISALGDTLYILNENGTLEPRLASSLPSISKDGLSIDIELKKNIFFHDGTLFNSKAMEFSINRFLKIGTQSYIIGDRIKSIETPDEYLLRLNLKRPSTSFNGLLTSINLTPVSPTFYSKYKNKFLNNNFIGTGAYKLISFQPEKQSIEPFKNYWGEKPKNKGIDYINYRNSFSLYGAIKNGDIDMLLSNSIADSQILSLSKMASKNLLNEATGPAMEIGYLTIRSNNEDFSNKLIRQAIALSIDRNLISKKVSFGFREPLRSITPKVLRGQKNSYWPKYNPSKARKLLIQSGFCRTKRLVIPLTYRSNVPADKLFALIWKEQIRRDLNDCLLININGIDSNTVYKQLSQGVFPVVMLDWTGAFPDAYAYLYPLFGCNEMESNICKKGEAVFSGTFWASSEIEKLLVKSEHLQGNKRSEVLETVEQIAAEGSAYVPIWNVRPRAWSKKTINKPKFDGTGFVLLKKLEKLNHESK